MWDPDPLAATDAELHVTAWADELRADEANRAACAAEGHHVVESFDGGMLCERCGTPESKINES